MDARITTTLAIVAVVIYLLGIFRFARIIGYEKGEVTSPARGVLFTFVSLASWLAVAALWVGDVTEALAYRKRRPARPAKTQKRSATIPKTDRG